MGVAGTSGPGWALIVVDDVRRGMALFRLLEWAGHRATVADRGEAVLGMVRTEPFDLLLLDASMSKAEGFELLRQIRMDPTLDYLPVLIIVPERDVGAVRAWIKAGADDCVTEPLMPGVVRTRIEAWLARKQPAQGKPLPDQ